ncbi:HAD family hydrolase [Permianibacter aggregans]|uniref:HAD superfamily hydrolase (TIGR01490 family) n=1 Tax=Permianibacter aggregans TaxID=1510150 RepID=A0A4R6UU21_9GAMM|nr:HAD family hydrolase [Permianibacter aggregans]QGX39502.1 HAD family hydrolase [Permianibacter aggregans]TDQ49756.1 HAD superfamily hydrolase (TIGR01490 family) [Permianibacter aggregans]
MTVLALFDLDHTLLNGDSDQLWGDFLREKAWVGPDYQQQKDRYYQDYLDGTLDYPSFIRFVLAPLKGRPLNELHQLRHEFSTRFIAPQLRAAGIAAVQQHQCAGHHVALITGSNRFLAEASAVHLQITTVLATEPVILDQQYTGEMSGEPCYREGKIWHLEQFLSRSGQQPETIFFYSDSHNDLPLLSKVSHPHVVCPDSILHQVASEKRWPILQW